MIGLYLEDKKVTLFSLESNRNKLSILNSVFGLMYKTCVFHVYWEVQSYNFCSIFFMQIDVVFHFYSESPNK